MHYSRGTTGTQQRLTETAGFIMLETALRPSTQVPMHTHENATIVLIMSGDYRETFRGRTIIHPPMTVIAKPAGERHANDIGAKGASCLVLELTNAKVSELDSICRPCEAPAVRRGGSASLTALKILRELRRPDALTPLALESAAMQMVVDLSRQPPADYTNEPRWVKQVIEMIHSEPPAGLRLARLADVIGVHPIHLARTFRRHYGRSIGRYVRSLQVERALAMITDTSTPLSEIALVTGFYDQSHMARVIREETGVTATQARAAARS